MDFLPMSTEYSEEQAFSFSAGIISLLKEQLLAGISEQYYIYPAQTVCESDSATFSLSFPSTIPVSGKAKIEFTVKTTTDGKTVLDTVLQTINTGSLKQKIFFKPLSGGNHIFTSTITSGNKKYSFSDSLFVEKQTGELQISGQNSTLLSEIGKPVSLKDSLLLARNLTTENRHEQLTEERFRLGRTWWLLALMLVLFGIEWAYRRRLGMD
jgi:hypothetical protein